MTEEHEKKSRRIALITSIGVHGAILLLLLFMVAWRAPNPPLSEYGIEINFGSDVQGSGEIQPETSVGAEQTIPEEETIPAEEETPVPEQPEEVIEEEIMEEAKPVEAASVQPEVVSKTESPVVVKEKEEVKPVEKPKEKPEIPKAVYKPKTGASTEGTANEKHGNPASQGDDVNKIGDKGDPQGTLDAKSLYGKHGGGGGGVSISGFGTFNWPIVETPALPDESYGIYEFKVKVDDQGYVISVTPVQRGLSFEAERRLKAAIQKLQFVPKGKPAPSEGRITFRVVSSKD